MIVPVVVDAERQIDFGPIDAATRDIAANLGPGTLVVYETTLPVGTTRDRFGPMLAEGSGLDARPRPASSPSARSACSSAASSSTCAAIRRSSAGRARRARGARSSSTASVLDEGTEVRAVANAEAAEMTKLAETTYRDVNIALRQRARPLRRAPRDRRHRGDRARPTRSRTATSTSRASASAVTASRSIPHFLFNTEPDLRLPPLAREINEGMARVHGRRDRGPHRLARRRSRCSCSASPTAATCARMPSAPPSACATSCAPPARGSTATTRTSTPSTSASVGFEPYDLELRRPVRVAVLQAAHEAYAALDPGRPPRPRALRRRPERARPRAVRARPGSRYVGIGR